MNITDIWRELFYFTIHYNYSYQQSILSCSDIYWGYWKCLEGWILPKGTPLQALFEEGIFSQGTRRSQVSSGGVLHCWTPAGGEWARQWQAHRGEGDHSRVQSQHPWESVQHWGSSLQRESSVSVRKVKNMLSILKRWNCPEEVARNHIHMFNLGGFKKNVASFY